MPDKVLYVTYVIVFEKMPIDRRRENYLSLLGVSFRKDLKIFKYAIMRLFVTIQKANVSFLSQVASEDGEFVKHLHSLVSVVNMITLKLGETPTS